MYKDILNKIIEKEKKNADKIGTNFPHNEIDGVYQYAPLDEWTNGYWSGMLWQLYLESGYDKFREIAEKQEEMLDEIITYDRLPAHDVGFVWLLTAGQHYKYNQNEQSRRRLLQMANNLAGRFNICGNFIRAWNGQEVKGYAIIDCMMNIPLLFLASEMIGDPRFAHIAKAHADTVLKYFIDDDGAVRHICNFDPATGNFIEALGGQGYAPDSSWSRGAGWAIYGFAMVYRYTKESKYLEASKKVADFFMEQVEADDFVPAWDFRAPNREIKDTSAGSLAASGMLEIANFVDDKDKYISNAKKLIDALIEGYSNLDNDNEAILTRATTSYPYNMNIEVGLIYADYYLVEALRKLEHNEFDLVWQPKK